MIIITLSLFLFVNQAFATITYNYPGAKLFGEEMDLPGIPEPSDVSSPGNSIQNYEQELINWGAAAGYEITPEMARELVLRPSPVVLEDKLYLNNDKPAWQAMRDILFLETVKDSMFMWKDQYIAPLASGSEFQTRQAFYQFKRISDRYTQYMSNSKVNPLLTLILGNGTNSWGNPLASDGLLEDSVEGCTVDVANSLINSGGIVIKDVAGNVIKNIPLTMVSNYYKTYGSYEGRKFGYVVDVALSGAAIIGGGPVGMAVGGGKLVNTGKEVIVNGIDEDSKGAHLLAYYHFSTHYPTELHLLLDENGRIVPSKLAEFPVSDSDLIGKKLQEEMIKSTNGLYGGFTDINYNAVYGESIQMYGVQTIDFRTARENLVKYLYDWYRWKYKSDLLVKRLQPSGNQFSISVPDNNIYDPDHTTAESVYWYWRPLNNSLPSKELLSTYPTEISNRIVAENLTKGLTFNLQNQSELRQDGIVTVAIRYYDGFVRTGEARLEYYPQHNNITLITSSTLHGDDSNAFGILVDGEPAIKKAVLFQENTLSGNVLARKVNPAELAPGSYSFLFNPTTDTSSPYTLHGPYEYWVVVDGKASAKVAVNVISSSDTDGDALPDIWENEMFGSLQYAAKNDVDNDGKTNYMEWRIGTHPLKTGFEEIINTVKYEQPYETSTIIGGEHWVNIEITNGNVDLRGRDVVIRGHFKMSYGSLNLNGGSLTIYGDFIQPGGLVELNGGKLIVKGKYQMVSTTTLQDGSVVDWEGTAGLIMSKPEDYVRVGGNFTVYSKGNVTLTDGTMEFKGDFVQRGYTSIWSWGRVSAIDFAAAGNHKVVFSGERAQTISFESPESSRFNILEINNTSEQGIILSTVVTVGGELKPTVSKIVYSKNLTPVGNAIISGTWPYDLGLDYYTYSSWVLQQDQVIEGNYFVGTGFGGNRLDLNGHSLTVRGNFYMDYSVTNVNLNGGTLVVEGNFIQSGGNLLFAGGKLNVGGNYRMQKEVTAEDGTVSYQDIYYQGKIIMNNPSDYMMINGDFIRDKENPNGGSNNVLEAGTVEVKGNIPLGFRKYYDSPANKLVLSGTGAQSFAGYVKTLQITNSSPEGITFLPGATVTEAVYSDSDVTKLNDLKNLYLEKTVLSNGIWDYDVYANSRLSWKLQQDQVVSKNVYSGAIDLNGYTLTVKGDVLGGRFGINGGKLLVEGKMENAAVWFNGGQVIVNGDYINGTMDMSTPEDYLLVKGNLISPGSNGHNLINGVIEVKGDFISGEKPFIPASQNKVVLSGDGRQNVSFTYPGSRYDSGESYFNSLEISNSSVEGVNFNTEAYVLGEVSMVGQPTLNPENLFFAKQARIKGGYWPYDITMNDGWLLQQDLTVDGNINLINDFSRRYSSYGGIDLNGHSLTVNKSVYHSSASRINIGSGRLWVKGDFKTGTFRFSWNDYDTKPPDWVRMNNQDGYVQVDGNINIDLYSSDGTSLTAGTINVKGNISIWPLMAGGTNKFILSGTGPQTVKTLYDDWDYFNIIQLENSSTEGVIFDSKLNVKKLFDHRGNKFTATVDSVFPDYDGDGVKDNLDPDPTVFTIDNTLPAVRSVIPGNGQTDVPVNQVVVIEFTEEIFYGINFGEIILRNASTVMDYTYSLQGTTLTITPKAQLASNTTYELLIPADALRDYQGNTLNGDQLFSFVTEDLVAKKNANLKDLKYNNETVPGFDPEIVHYNVQLPPGTVTVPTVTAVAENTGAKVKVYPADSLPGTTMVEVIAVDGSTYKVYRINFTVPADAYEPDSTYLQANIIPTDGSTQTHKISPAGEVDWIKFDAQAGQRYIIKTANLSPYMDTYIHLFDTDGMKQINENDDYTGAASLIDWTAVTSGTYYIKVRHYSSTGTGQYDISVLAQAVTVRVAGVYLTKNNTAIGLGLSETLGYSITPSNATNKTVEWTSSNPEVVTVDQNGMINGVGNGTALITITTQDGNYVGHCTVTVDGIKPTANSTLPVSYLTNSIVGDNTLIAGDQFILKFSEVLQNNMGQATAAIQAAIDSVLGLGVAHVTTLDNTNFTVTIQSGMTVDITDGKNITLSAASISDMLGNLSDVISFFLIDQPLFEPPVFQVNSNVVGQPATITFTDDGKFQSSITGIQVDGMLLSSSDFSISNGEIVINGNIFPAPQIYQIQIIAAGYSTHLIGYQALTEQYPPSYGWSNSLFGQPAVISFLDDGKWASSIKGISVNGSYLSASEYSVTLMDGETSQYSITINGNQFSQPGIYEIRINATGYVDAVFYYEAYNSGPNIDFPQAVALSQPLEITFTDGGIWHSSINRIDVDWSTLEVGSYEITGNKIRINADVFTAEKEYYVWIVAPGYNTEGGWIRVDGTPPTANQYSPVSYNSSDRILAAGDQIALQFSESLQNESGQAVASIQSAVDSTFGSGVAVVSTYDNMRYLITIQPSMTVDLTTGYNISLVGGSVSDIAGNQCNQISFSLLLKAPSLYISEALVNHPVEIRFYDGADWQASVNGISVDGVQLGSDEYTITDGLITINGNKFAEPKTYEILITANGYYNEMIWQNVIYPRPVLKYPSVLQRGNPLEVIFTDDGVWHSSISEVQIDGTMLPSTSYSILNNKLTINNDVFSTDKGYQISIFAPNYITEYLYTYVITPSVVGTVYSPDGNVFLPGQGTYAQVNISSPNYNASTQINSDGSYLIGQIPDGDYVLAVRIYGENIQYTDSLPVTIHVVNGSITRQDMTLTNPAITGKILTPDGLPFNFEEEFGADILVKFPDGHVDWSPVDISGTYKLGGLLPGTYQLIAIPWGNNNPYTRSFPLDITIEEGVSKVLDIRLSNPTVTGYVYTPDGDIFKPGLHGWAQIVVSAIDGQEVERIDLNENGSYKIGGLPDGTFTLKAKIYEGPYIESLPLTVNIGNNSLITQNITLSIQDNDNSDQPIIDANTPSRTTDVSYDRPISLSAASNRPVNWTVTVFNPNNQLVATIASDTLLSEFSTVWAPSDPYQASGTYTIKYNAVDSHGSNATEITQTIEVYNYPIRIKQVRILNVSEVPVNEVRQGESFQVETTIENLNNSIESPMLIVQTKDPNGKVVSIGTVKLNRFYENDILTLTAGTTLSNSAEYGYYTVDVMVWSGWEMPEILSEFYTNQNAFAINMPGVGLKQTISEAQYLIELAIVGDEMGNYPQQAIDELNVAISGAQSVLDNESATQEHLFAAEEALYQAIDNFREAMVRPAAPTIGLDGNDPHTIVVSDGQEGALISLYHVMENGEIVPELGPIDWEELTQTIVNGYARFGNIEPGTYTVTQTVYGIESNYSNFVEVPGENGTGGNEAVQAPQLELDQTDTHQLIVTNAVDGALIKLYYVNPDGTYTREVDVQGQQLTAIAYGSTASFSNIGSGKYAVTQTVNGTESGYSNIIEVPVVRIYGVINEWLMNTRGMVTATDITTSEGKAVRYDVNTLAIDISTIESTLNMEADAAIADNDFVKISLDDSGKIDDLLVLTATDYIGDANHDLKKIRVNDLWYYCNADTKIINANGTDDATTVLLNDFLSKVENGTSFTGFVKLDGSYVKFILFEGGKTFSVSNKAMVVDKYYRDGDCYVEIDVRGTVYIYKIDSAAYADVYEDQLYNYSIDGTKVILADAGLTFESTTVDGIDISTMSIEAGNASYQIDSDTYLYDLTGDDPVWIDFNQLSVGDNVRFCVVNGDDNRTGVINVLFVE